MSLLLVALVTLSASVAQDLRWTNKGKVKVRRQTETDPDMAEVARTLSEMAYAGEIQTSAQDGIWLPTTQGVMQQYTTPSKSISVKLDEAVKLCREQGGRLWDRDPQQATGFSEIEFGQPYWILSEDGSMAEYTTNTETPESVYDSICTQIYIAEPEEGTDQKIEVRTVFDTTAGSGQGCTKEEFKGLTLCLRPVKEFTYANNPDYRQDQEETKTLIQQEKAGTRLQDIEEELMANNFQTNMAKPKITAKLQIIKTNIDNIKLEDQKPFPNFRRIKADWKELLTQMQDLEGISTRILHEEQIKQVNNQITINKGQQAQDEQDWNRKWTDMRKQIEDNKNKIQHSNSTTTTTRVPDRDAERTVQEEEEEDQTDNKVVGYFQNILQELKTKKQNYDEFCSQWQLDCGIIAWTSLIMIAIGIITMIVAITLAITTYDLNKRVHRLYEYMDLQATRKEQEEDDSSWKTRISNPNDTFNDFTPNPTRNRAQMKKNYTNLNNKINQTQQVLLTNGFNITDIKINQPGGQRELGRDQEQGATFPLLGQ